MCDSIPQTIASTKKHYSCFYHRAPEVVDCRSRLFHLFRVMTRLTLALSDQLVAPESVLVYTFLLVEKWLTQVPLADEELRFYVHSATAER